MSSHGYAAAAAAHLRAEEMHALCGSRTRTPKTPPCTRIRRTHSCTPHPSSLLFRKHSRRTPPPANAHRKAHG
eukprot:4573547-Pleurochrysis_carterae.AAC.2